MYWIFFLSYKGWISNFIFSLASWSSRWEAGAVPALPQQQQALLPGSDGPGHAWRTGQTGLRAWRELLHGRPRHDLQQGGAAQDGSSHQHLSSGDAHHPRGRGGGPLRPTLWRNPVRLVLWGEDCVNPRFLAGRTEVKLLSNQNAEPLLTGKREDVRICGQKMS